MATIDEALKVKNCANELLDVLSKYYSDDAGMAYTTIVFLLVRLTNTMGLDPDQVILGLKQGFNTQKLLDVEVDSDWVN